MYDRQTGSLWHHLTGEPVVGPLASSGLRLRVLPVVVATWAEWRAAHPDTGVLDLRTGHVRDYTPGRPYGAYFASPTTMFPVAPRSDRFPAKTELVAVRTGDARKAFPLAVFARTPVINDRVGDTPVVLLGHAASRTVRVYERGDLLFVPGTDPGRVAERDGGPVWTVREEHLLEPASGRTLPRVPAHLVYWFGWHAFFPHADVYAPSR